MHKYVPSTKADSEHSEGLEGSGAREPRELQTHVMVKFSRSELIISKGTLEFVEDCMFRLDSFDDGTPYASAEDEEADDEEEGEPEGETAKGTDTPNGGKAPASTDAAPEEDDSLDLTFLSGSLGTISLCVCVSPQTVKLMCTPLTDVVCILELGSASAMVSTAKRSDDNVLRTSLGTSHSTGAGDGRAVYLYNASIGMESLTAKIHHPKYPDDAVGVVVNNVRANLSLMKTGDKVQVTVLLPVESITVLFSVMQLKEFFLFQQIWMAGLRLSSHDTSERKEGEESSDAAKSAQPEARNEQDVTDIIERSEKFIARVRQHVNVFVLLSLGHVEVQNNLGQSVGQVGVSLNELSLRFNAPEIGPTAPRTILSMDASLGEVAVLCEGSLNGSANVSGITFIGGRHQPAQAPKMNQFTFYIEKAAAELDYNMSPIVALKAGTIVARIRDVPPAGDDRSQNEELMSEGEVVLPEVRLCVASESITAVGSIAILILDKISEYHASAIHKARAAFTHQRKKEMLQRKHETLKQSRMGADRHRLTRKERLAAHEERQALRAKKKANLQQQLLTSQHQKSATQTSQDEVARSLEELAGEKRESDSLVNFLLSKLSGIVPSGNFFIRSSLLELSIYGFSLRDPAWLSLSLGSLKVKLVQKYKAQVQEIHRQLSIAIKECEIEKCSANELEETVEGTIFQIPSATIVLYTLQALETPSDPSREPLDIKYWFVTEFNDSVFISVNLGLYTFLKDTVMLYKQSVEDLLMSIDRLKQASQLMYTSDIQVKAMDIPVPEKKPDLRRFCEEKWVLEPKLSVLGDQTPKVSTVLRWLGIEEHQVVPKLLHVVATDNLEIALKGIGFLSILLGEGSLLSSTMRAKARAVAERNERPGSSIPPGVTPSLPTPATPASPLGLLDSGSASDFASSQ
eukprot:TRINITY_DN3998_c0_g1_i1.p1 TRINITY_DN3998_c0_g1~~TRINITY_DN3998_c0_g1_i1.p1  ORF type:complete len:1017 (-),score=303.38 TRINITY_DN3998_c0_g1_i1:128-2875(-)